MAAAEKTRLVKERMEETLERIDQMEDKKSVKQIFFRHVYTVQSQPNEILFSISTARILYLRGRTLNVLTGHSPEAEAALSKAVKLVRESRYFDRNQGKDDQNLFLKAPEMVEAWNELGECCWKRGDAATAKTCFEGALRHVSHE